MLNFHGTYRANPNDFDFEVQELKKMGMVKVTVEAKRKYKGLLITTNFVTESTTKADNADLSDGVWMGSGSKGFKLVNDKKTGTPGCGVTHDSNQEKEGRHSFFFKPSNNAWKDKGFRVLIVSEPKEIFHHFHIGV